MRPFLIFTFILAPALALAQVEKAADVRAAPAPVAGPGGLTAPTPLSLTVPNLAAAPVPAPIAAVPTVMAPAPVPVMRAAPSPAAEHRTPGARGELEQGGRLAAAPDLNGGRLVFDGGLPRDAAPALTAGAAASDRPRLSRPAGAAAAPAKSIPLKQRAGETAELGVMTLGFQLVTGLAYLWLGAHAAFPLLAGALWALAGAELIKQLGNLRSVIVGGWQASHDQKMRTDYSTGRLRDIRGKKYGQDRYDEYAPGAVSPRERLVTDAAAFALGLPWVLPAGPQAVALYTAGAAAAFALRRLWRARRPEPAPADRKPDFEYDR